MEVCKDENGRLPESPKDSKYLPQFYQKELATLDTTIICSSQVYTTVLHDSHSRPRSARDGVETQI